VSPRRITKGLVREVPSLRQDDTVAQAVRRIVESGLPALPVVDDQARLCGIFGEREFMTALFPGYVGQLGYAGFIDVSYDFSDVEVAETFLHHRVLIVPVTRDRRVTGVITRSDFFHRLAERFLDAL
jgi:CBS domain-containing protein